MSEEIDETTTADDQPHPITISLVGEITEMNMQRVDEINQRLSAMGYHDYEHPAVVCPAFLMTYELSTRCVRSKWLDAVNYSKRMNAYMNEYRRTKKALDVKITELINKNLSFDDMMEFTFKEDRNGYSLKLTIGNYYECHQIAASNLMKFLEIASPVDGGVIFNEKNRLVDEKMKILLETRKMQLDLLLQHSNTA